MNRIWMAVAVGAALAPAAHAQTNVSLYGIVDVGISADRDGGAEGDAAVRVNSGYMSPSRFGITGADDIGGGLKGLFTLEAGFDADTGGFKTYRGNPGGATANLQGLIGAATNLLGTNLSGGFNRRAFVGLQGGFGTISLGRDYTPFYWAHSSTDVLGYGLYGNLRSIYQVTGTGTEQAARASNAVFYTSHVVSGLTVRAMASAGGENFGGAMQPGAAVPPPRSANRMVGLGAYYASGPLVVSAAIQAVRLAQVRLTDTEPLVSFTGGTIDRRDWIVGLKYDFGAFSLGGGHARTDPTGPARAEQSWAGGTVSLGRGTLLLQVQRLRHDFAVPSATARGTADTASLSYTYPFSRRTTGYASLGYVRNNDESAIALSAGNNQVGDGLFGADPRGFVLGVRHSF